MSGGRWARGWAAAVALVAAILFAPLATHAADEGASDWFVTEQGQVRLISAVSGVGQDRSVQLGLEFRLAPHWKIYWRSPGDAGYPPRLDWAGSENLKTAQISWPAPLRFSVLGLETMGYTDHVVLPILAQLDHPGAPLALHAALDYLTCAEICIPYQTTLTLTVPAGPLAPTRHAIAIAQFAARIPHAGNSAALAIQAATWRPGKKPMLELTIRSDAPLTAPDAFIEGAGNVGFGAPKKTPGAAAGESTLTLAAGGDAAALAAIPGHVLTVTLVDGARALEAPVIPALGAPAVDLATLLPILALALLGGLILNVMPCVLPVLALKLLGAISHADRSRAAMRLGFLATAAGIIASFLVLAASAIALRAAGAMVGWGVQFQDPLFLTAMVALLTLFAANLWGFFEVPLPGAVATLSQRARGRALLGNFATGAFATLLATPCSAPFLGTAVGFALAAGPGEILVVFIALGIGFALPYLLVAAIPQLAQVLPRPGQWMIWLRRLLGVSLAATAAWLIWVLGAETSPSAGLAVALLMLVALACLAWLRMRLLRRATVAVALLAAWLLPVAISAPPAISAASDSWRAFDPAAIDGLVRDGHVVFVDVTADWCLTCKVNERFVLDTAAVREELAAPGVVAMRADWTRPSALIAAYLQRFGRYGIPFNAIYGPAAPAGVALPEILTADRVTAGMREAAGPGAQRAER